MRSVKILAAVLAALIILTVCAAAAENTAVVYEIKEDFSGAADKTPFTEYAHLTEHWTAENATQQHISVTDKETLRFEPFSQLILNRRLTGPYVFKSDVRVPGGQFFGVFVRTTGEALSGTPYFEHDGTLDDKGGADNEGIGATGIYVIPREKKIIVCVKTADETQAKGIGTDKTYFDTEADFSAGFAELCFEDDGETVKIYAAGKLVCYIGLSEITKADFMSEHALYTKADIYGADGQLAKTVTNCRVCAEYSTVAYGMRISAANIDNIYICEYEKPADEKDAERAIKRVDIKYQPEKSEYLIGEELDLTDTYLEVTYDNGVKEDVRVTADMVEGFDSKTTGVKLLTVMYKKTSASYSVTVVSEHTEPVTTERETIDFDTSPATSQSAAAQGGNRTVIIIVAVIAAVIIIALLLFIILKGKKPDDEKL